MKTVAEEIAGIKNWCDAINKSMELSVKEDQDYDAGTSKFYFEDGSIIEFSYDDKKVISE